MEKRGRILRRGKIRWGLNTSLTCYGIGGATSALRRDTALLPQVKFKVKVRLSLRHSKGRAVIPRQFVKILR